jgi:glutamine amidotransferase/cyclase
LDPSVPVDHAHISPDDRYYFVHSFAALLSSDRSLEALKGWAYSTTTYQDETFVSSIQKGNLFATQFHPEKSGKAGLAVLSAFLKPFPNLAVDNGIASKPSWEITPKDQLSKRIIACLDVRANDHGDLVVTKGDQYDVREKEGGLVRNLGAFEYYLCTLFLLIHATGKPVELAKRYYDEGADEITFLNITSFRDCPLRDTPMLKVLEQASESIFVPLTIGIIYYFMVCGVLTLRAAKQCRRRNPRHG